MNRMPAIIRTQNGDGPEADACVMVVGIPADLASALEGVLSEAYGLPVCTGYLAADVTLHHDGETCPVHEDPQPADPPEDGWHVGVVWNDDSDPSNRAKRRWCFTLRRYEAGEVVETDVRRFLEKDEAEREREAELA